jgi:hypothetical protein
MIYIITLLALILVQSSFAQYSDSQANCTNTTIPGKIKAPKFIDYRVSKPGSCCGTCKIAADPNVKIILYASHRGERIEMAHAKTDRMGNCTINFKLPRNTSPLYRYAIIASSINNKGICAETQSSAVGVCFQNIGC